MKRNEKCVVKKFIEDKVYCARIESDGKIAFANNISSEEVDALAKEVGIVFSKEKSMRSILKNAKKEELLFLLERKVFSIREQNKQKEDDERLKPTDLQKIRYYIDLINLIFSSRPELAIAYEETELYRLHEVICPVCGAKMSFYKYANYNMYRCDNNCGTQVSCHKDSALPAGIVANARTRQLRIRLHNLAEELFGKNIKYSIFSKIIDRSFDELSGHIGSMNEEECNKVINFLYFLKECSGRLNEVKGVSEKEYLLEEYFISNATHEELRAYYVLVKNNFSLSTLKERIKLSSEDFAKLVVSLTKKGICTTYWNLEEMSEDVKEALILREELSEKLLSYSPKEKRKIIII